MMQHSLNKSAQRNGAISANSVRGTAQVLYSATGSSFEIGRALGNGGMGQVYLALYRSTVHAQEARLVALKILRPDAPAQARRLFYHEGTLLPRLQHTHIVQHIERGRGAIPSSGSFDYLASEFIAGDTVEALLRRQQGPLPLATVLGIVAQITGALGYLHQRGIVHCDLKPSNIMLEHASPRAVLIDFGISRAPDFAGQPVAVGTPQYMAPEQADAQAHCDGRADLYALGIVLYELLTGRRLFPQRTTTDIRRGHLLMPDHRALAAHLEEPIAQVITRCVCPDPSDRYPSAELLLHDLRRAGHMMLSEPPLQSRAVGE